MVGGGREREEGTRERLIGSGGAEEMGEAAETDNERWKSYSSGKTKGGHVVEVSGGRGAELEAPGPHKGEPDVNTEGDSHRSLVLLNRVGAHDLQAALLLACYFLQ